MMYRAHESFDLAHWLPKFPLEPIRDAFRAYPITSPRHVCWNEQLRREVWEQVDWGEGIPVDIFIFANGEPENRFVTKIGGLPYRPIDRPWPVAQTGHPMRFLGQICFVDSRDHCGPLPGDVLLVFADPVTVGSFAFEWSNLGVDGLVEPDTFPRGASPIHPCYGYILRVMNYPLARPKRRHATERLTCRGLQVGGDFLLFQYQATQIGRAPFFIQTVPELRGRMLCCLSSINPDAFGSFPWINEPEPLRNGYRMTGDYGGYLSFGDMGCLYCSIDEHGCVFAEEQQY